MARGRDGLYGDVLRGWRYMKGRDFTSRGIEKGREGSLKMSRTNLL